MDTVHDLGGRQGFGPIPNTREDDSALFSEEWKARIWAIAMMSMTKLSADRTGWTLDWYRHVLERLGPADYLSMNYFEKWVQAMMTTVIDLGFADIEEFVEGRSHSVPPVHDPKPLSASAGTEPALFHVGDEVVTKNSISAMHTRLPSYARGRKGVIEHYIGPEVLADASATGDLRIEHLYTVRFDSNVLWPEEKGRGASVHLDLWESYFEPT